MRKQNQWQIKDIYTDEVHFFSIGVKESKSRLANFIKGGLTVLISVLIIFSVVKAGTITPPSGEPSAQFYTLTDIYNRLNDSSTASERNHLFTFADPLSGTHYSLTEIYDKIPTIEPSKLLNDTTYLGVTGNIATLTLSSATETVSAGYYDAITLSAVDSDLATTNIMADVSIFGVTGTLLKNLYTGTSRSDSLSTVTLNAGGSGYTPGAQVLTVTQSGASGGTVNVTVDAGGVVTSVDSIATTGKGYSVADGLATTGGGGTGAKVNITAVASHYPIAVGGVDDYNDNTTTPADSYQGSWTDCTSSPYCGADSNADKKDNSTGLIWSVKIDDAGDDTQTWFWANNCKYPNQLTGDDGTCDTNGEIACKCVKLTSSKTGCEALGDGGWRLPSQKELMQAYIDGSWANLSSAGYGYWSATTISYGTHYAWYLRLYYGGTRYGTKTFSTIYRVRCVR